MIKKLQVVIREVYEGEEMQEKIKHNVTGQEISSWDFGKLSTIDQAQYTFGQYPTGKSKVEIPENDPIYGQIFNEENLDIKDLILHLNRTR